MKRFGIHLGSLVLAVAAWMAPASAQEKYTVGYGAGT
jgi:hypothetical protein